ncbi:MULTISPECIES: restriction endonuclease subunit S [Bacillus cereus group]|uniref:restriction endonuclease subunit S n=1 Tax=Bacillus cereus group TaxID=86661 RepID=UPI001C73D6BB|nr:MULTISPECIES: restriction endonuclease subunit S [Bacillus cereus group]MBX0351303.1 restriction endonuclease subunit S [Bacillus toyonensis]MDA2027109.1 restriction endonuclease subunit S [Bacillus cereus group sp. Bcc03]
MKNNHTPDIRFAGFTEDWEQRKLGELIEISSASRVHKNEWTTSGVRFFRSSDVVSNFNGKKNIPAFISYSLYDELSKKSGLVQPGDILVTGGGSIGIPYLVADQEPLYFKDADLIWLKSANKIDGYFLYSYFVTPQLRKYISSITHIGTISHYTIVQAKDTPIILPERVEQTLIGNFLKHLDDTIALHQQELTTLKQTKQGFLQKMFPKEGESVPEVRFPGFTGDWEQRKVSEITLFHKQGFYTTENYDDSKKYYLLRGTDLTDNRLQLKDTPKINASEKEYKDFKAQKGDFLIVRSGTVGTYGIVYEDIEAIFGSYLINFRFDMNLVTNEFFGYFYQSDLYRTQLRQIIQQSANTNINAENIKSVSISLPKIDEQVKIGEFLKNLDNLVTLHQRELDALKETKKAFLQKMFV